jgi:CRP-like cAMP-binding protein
VGSVAAYDLIERDGREWVEVINRSVLDRVPLFKGANDTLLHSLTLSLDPAAASAGEEIVRKGDVGRRCTSSAAASVDVIDGDGKVIKTMGEGDFFGELALLCDQPAQPPCARQRRATCSSCARATSSAR